MSRTLATAPPSDAQHSGAGAIATVARMLVSMVSQNTTDLNGPTLLLGGMLPTSCREDGPESPLPAPCRTHWLRCTAAAAELSSSDNWVDRSARLHAETTGNVVPITLADFHCQVSRRLLDLPSCRTLEAACHVSHHLRPGLPVTTLPVDLPNAVTPGLPEPQEKQFALANKTTSASSPPRAACSYLPEYFGGKSGSCAKLPSPRCIYTVLLLNRTAAQLHLWPFDRKIDPWTG